MTRIVSGTAKGRTLKVPGSGTRPTSERVREAVFSRLEHLGFIRDCEVLDLYAGSGALGFEAASRGASHVELVDSSRSAVEIIRKNSAAIGLPVKATCAKARTWVEATPDRRFDLVFLDPPYAIAEEELSAVLDGLGAHIKPDAMVVVERSSRSPEPGWPEGWELTDERSFGDTRIWSAGPAIVE